MPGINDTKWLLEYDMSIWLSWDEPRQAMHEHYEPTTAHVQLSALVRDCINMQRRNDATRSLPDARLLEDFIAVNYAYLSDS